MRAAGRARVVFLSYAHEDADLLDRLVVVLKPLVRRPVAAGGALPCVLRHRTLPDPRRPTAALDARAKHELFELTVARDRSVLLISHRFSSVRSADRILVLHEGRVIEEGSHDDLRAAGGRYAGLFTLQGAAYLHDAYRET